uniref:Putative flippase AglR n=1 Tax=Candidatus Methanogaster sp. ANME-2c ERB4 TaxID=2759911 RepID=A0A7G9YLD8_9EURY|nr:putative flippase AglR [Methanosarcinales archaeon ANME-2c ERB4]
MIKQKVQQETITNIGVSIAITIIGFLSTMYFAHTLGSETLGMYYIFLSVYGVLNLFCDSGFGGATIKRISEGKEQGEYWTGAVLVRIIVYAIIVTTILIFKDYFNNLIGIDATNILIVTIALSSFASFFSHVIIGLDHIRISALAGLVNSAGRTLIQVSLVFFGWQFFGLIYGYIFGMISAIAVVLYYSIRYDIRVKPKMCQYRHIRSLFSYAAFTFLNGVGGTIFEYADVMIIGIFLLKGDAGIYGVIWSFSSISLFISSAMVSTMFPKISRWSTDGNWKEVETSFGMALTYSLIIAVPILFGGILLGGDLLYYAYGVSFAGGAFTLTIILLMRVFQVSSTLTMQYLQGIDHPDIVFRVISFTATLNIILNWFLIQWHGIEGAAVATLVTTLLTLILGYRYLKKFIALKVDWKGIRAIVSASIIMVGVIYALMGIFVADSVLEVLAEVGIGAIVYGVVLIGLNKNIRDELWTLRRIKLI